MRSACGDARSLGAQHVRSTALMTYTVGTIGYPLALQAGCELLYETCSDIAGRPPKVGHAQFASLRGLKIDGKTRVCTEIENQMPGPFLCPW